MVLKLYQSETWLKQQYQVNKFSLEEIARLANTTPMTIYRYLSKFGLIRNPRTWTRK